MAKSNFGVAPRYRLAVKELALEVAPPLPRLIFYDQNF